MNVAICLDDRLGMTFNGRRQSRDRLVCEDIVKDARGGTLLMAEFSRNLFVSMGAPFICAEGFLDIAKKGDTCFVENKALSSYVHKIERLVIYRWNRHYPSDMTFDIDPEREGFRLLTTEEFAGNSHEKITKEIYVK